MTETLTRERGTSVWPVWAWRFTRIEDLTEALTEYTAFQDGTLTRHYGDPDDRGSSKLDPRVEMNAAKKRAEIDKCMGMLQHTYTFYWRLLDLFFCSGASTEFGAWQVIGKRLGIRRRDVVCEWPACKCPVKTSNDDPEDNREQEGLKNCKAMVAMACQWDRETFEKQLDEGIKRLYYIHNRRWDAMQRGRSGGGE